ncbi:MAG: tRNA (adenosine(37)-N6)-threonylcarbamoyltransferase complex ATPase subunit type 1 TsaE [Candidatus Paceibacterota bacterium]
MKYEGAEREKLGEIARKLVKKLTPHTQATLVVLKGELGAGKTTFVQEIAGIFGIEEPITSPTYVIQKIYELEGQPFKQLIHIDAYRLESGEELLSLGFNTLLEDPQTIIFLEWPERVEEILPSDIVSIYFEHKEEGKRDITIEGI